MIRSRLVNLSNSGKRLAPRCVKRWITDHLWNPARVFDSAGHFPSIVCMPEDSACRPLPANTRVAFQHIPKTAGSSFRRMLESMVPRRETCTQGFADADIRRIEPGKFAGYRLVCGHITIDLLVDLLPDAEWLTFLRDPVERVVSHHANAVNTARQSTDWKRWANDREPVRRYLDTIEGMPLDQFLALDDPRAVRDTTNLQTRVLVERSFRLTIGNEACTGHDPRIIDRAKANLRERYRFVGVQEEFEASLELFARTYGLHRSGAGFVANVNPSKHRSSGYEISGTARDIIADRNQMDAELHAFARELMHERLEALRAYTPS